MTDINRIGDTAERILIFKSEEVKKMSWFRALFGLLKQDPVI